MNEKISFGQIDLFKFIASLLVITIHTDPLSTYSESGNFILTRIIARLAVPFFFISAGYLLSIQLIKNKKYNNKIIFRYIKKILNIYIISILIYIPLNIYNGYFSKNISVEEVLKDLLFNGTLYHLWYLPALIIGIIIVYLLVNNFSFKISFIVTLALYIIGIFGDSYFGIIENINSIDIFYRHLFEVFDYTRNGIFFAPIFIILGFKLSKLYNLDKKDMSCNNDLKLFILFFTIFAIEATLLKINNIPKHDSMTIFLVPSVYFMFKLCLNFKNKNMKNLRNLSLYIYIIHPMMIVVVRLIGKLTRGSDVIVNNSVINYLLVVVLSIFISALVINIKKSRKSKAYIK